jgi:hypothetical protein
MTLITEFWTEVLQGPLVLILATAAATYAGVLARKLNTWLGLQNEQKLREALHQAAENAIGFAAGKSGLSVADALRSGLRETLLAVAADYVKDKNPTALRKLAVDDGKLADILVAKIGKGV